jgi:hypothetical protein
MGLDMYLYSKVRKTAFKDEDKNSPLHKAAEAEGLKDNAGRGNYGYVAIECQAGYWRKANAIHNWFVHNVQDGRDECQQADVDISQIVALRELCEKVIGTAKLIDVEEDGVQYKTVSNKEEVHALLPPVGGFFFGSTDVDQWFIEDVKHTIEVCKHCEELTARHGYDVEFSYRSSW